MRVHVKGERYEPVSKEGGRERRLDWGKGRWAGGGYGWSVGRGKGGGGMVGVEGRVEWRVEGRAEGREVGEVGPGLVLCSFFCFRRSHICRDMFVLYFRVCAHCKHDDIL